MGAFPIKVIDPLWHLYTYSSCFQWKEKAFYKPTQWVKKLKNKENQNKNWKNRIVKKTWLNWLKFWKNRPVWFGFISLKLKKLNRTEPKPKKTSQTGWPGPGSTSQTGFQNYNLKKKKVFKQELEVSYKLQLFSCLLLNRIS